MYILVWSLIVSLAINTLMLLIAYRLQSDKLTDISYALSFIALAILGLTQTKHITLYTTILFLLVAIWAIRIGSFLLHRVIQKGKDARFDDMRKHFTRFGKFWLGQAITVWVVMIAASIALTHGDSIKLLGYVGIGIWFAGLLLETIADFQKYKFAQNPNNKNKWIQNGLWHYSRHPNYLGEILTWVGVYVLALNGLPGYDALIGFISPLFITFILVFATGIPILEKRAEKRWGTIAAYQEYKKRTGVLFPKLTQK